MSCIGGEGCQYDNYCEHNMLIVIRLLIVGMIATLVFSSRSVQSIAGWLGSPLNEEQSWIKSISIRTFTWTMLVIVYLSDFLLLEALIIGSFVLIIFEIVAIQRYYDYVKAIRWP